ncbi:hypothetical protein [Thermococcus sp. 2319x1]|uniref:hypothetical protein n=1 Tax=Thermococcus sp. 2319x1 TaxID=1674923 RepID=UPI0015815088|nr:hypothetical protein [Thermococcus sp. 2319x1]
MEKAVEKLSSRMAELSKEKPTPDLLSIMGLYSYALELVKNERWDEAKALLELAIFRTHEAQPRPF